MNLSVVIITLNEEANVGRTLTSVKPLVADGNGEIIVVDSGSTDRTIEIAKSFGAKVFVEHGAYQVKAEIPDAPEPDNTGEGEGESHQRVLAPARVRE